ncbi:MAG: multidrug effflux MFS transporter [Bacteroidota bacterium]
MSQVATKPTLKLSEFIPMMAVLTSLVALSIDAMLPALSIIGEDLQVADPNAPQLVISMIFLGMSVGQAVFGTLSDSYGRKPTVYFGLVIFIVGCLISWSAPSLYLLLVGRVLQGFGVSGPRVVVLALVRDQYAGNKMAKIMSYVMMVFIMIPTVAPALGQGIMYLADWRAIFLVFIGIGLIAGGWFGLRQPETLTPEDRKPLRWGTIGFALKEIFSSRVALGYTVTAGLISGAFLGFLTSIEPILMRQYGLGEAFAGYFAMLALFIGSASFVNSRLVERLGMQRLSQLSVSAMTLLAFGFLAYLLFINRHPDLWVLMPYLFATLFCVGIMFGNLNSLAMEPMGHIAGIGASVVSAMGTLIAFPFSIIIGQAYDGSSAPMVFGFAIMGLLTFFLMRFIEAGRTTVPIPTVKGQR